MRTACSTTLTVTPERQLAIPDGGFEPQDIYECDLGNGHPGSHGACLQNDDDPTGELWAMWDDREE